MDFNKLSDLGMGMGKCSTVRFTLQGCGGGRELENVVFLGAYGNSWDGF
jgi:hypothetical protein